MTSSTMKNLIITRDEIVVVKPGNKVPEGVFDKIIIDALLTEQEIKWYEKEVENKQSPNCSTQGTYLYTSSE